VESVNRQEYKDKDKDKNKNKNKNMQREKALIRDEFQIENRVFFFVITYVYFFFTSPLPQLVIRQPKLLHQSHFIISERKG